ncbi:MAG: adenosylcobinamide-GDP ribazoletransferase [Fretibacterium sp.]|nr:adenosylcobinamide-GDP ribazoletransferase [Fretibacterium sp.]
MRTIDIIRSFFIACSFLTILPVPGVEWKEQSVRFFCLMLPLVGGILGVIWALGFVLLSHWGASPLLRGVVMTLVALALTGGLHMDGLMDTCDALLSRRDQETRLKILSDTHVGAFAVMGCVSVLMLKGALFSELFTASYAKTPLLLGLIPVWSRLGMGLLLNSLPFARDDGLARTLGASRTPLHSAILLIGALVLAVVALWSGVVWLPIVWGVAFLLWRRCCLSAFGGITGDLLGAFAELSETALLFALLECLQGAGGLGGTSPIKI